ncbi:MAG: octanoyltransferase LipM [Bacillota bacterium]|jgi:lipoate-protein ligase A
MKQQWRYIPSHSYSPAFNMAIDEAIMHEVAAGVSPPTIRFYRWQPATLSIGYFQSALKEIDLEKVKEKNIGLVRRPTGGRAVLHDQELTYSIILPESYPDLARSVTESYRMLSLGLVEGFKRLGLQAEMVNLSNKDGENQLSSLGSAACFDSPSWYELVVEGQKIAGSAQVRQKGVVLQHGSVLLNMDVNLLFDLLQFSDESKRARMKKGFATKAVAINDLLLQAGLQEIGLDQLEESFEIGMAEGLNVTFNEGVLTEAEQKRAEQLVNEKYGNDSYTLKK